jgi:hypothetical protein
VKLGDYALRILVALGLAAIVAFGILFGVIVTLVQKLYVERLPAS